MTGFSQGRGVGMSRGGTRQGKGGGEGVHMGEQCRRGRGHIGHPPRLATIYVRQDIACSGEMHAGDTFCLTLTIISPSSSTAISSASCIIPAGDYMGDYAAPCAFSGLLLPPCKC